MAFNSVHADALCAVVAWGRLLYMSDTDTLKSQFKRNAKLQFTESIDFALNGLPTRQGVAGNEMFDACCDYYYRATDALLSTLVQSWNSN